MRTGAGIGVSHLQVKERQGLLATPEARRGLEKELASSADTWCRPSASGAVRQPICCLSLLRSARSGQPHRRLSSHCRHRDNGWAPQRRWGCGGTGHKAATTWDRPEPYKYVKTLFASHRVHNRKETIFWSESYSDGGWGGVRGKRVISPPEQVTVVTTGGGALVASGKDMTRCTCRPQTRGGSLTCPRLHPRDSRLGGRD